jgi:uncharacterized caspase-like protein
MQVSTGIQTLISIILIPLLSACAAPPLSYSDRVTARPLKGFDQANTRVAADGEGEHGVYTKHLLHNMRKPGLSVEQVFKKVLQGVNRETDGKQVPWTESSFTGEFSFLPAN